VPHFPPFLSLTPGPHPSPYDEFRWIRDLANSAKHRQLTQEQEVVARAGIKPSGVLAYNRAGGLGVSTGGYASATPKIFLKDGSEHTLLSVVNSVQAFWEAHFG
jgi:hypothetical protein